MFRKGLIGKKLGMTQIFEDGARIPVTVVELGPNTIVQKKLPEGKDGYGAIQIGFGEKEHRKVNKAMTGHFNRADVKPVRELCEIRVPDDAKLAEYEVGQEIKLQYRIPGWHCWNSWYPYRYEYPTSSRWWLYE